jgi:hypothetical protein
VKLALTILLFLAACTALVALVVPPPVPITLSGVCPTNMGQCVYEVYATNQLGAPPLQWPRVATFPTTTNSVFSFTVNLPPPVFLACLFRNPADGSATWATVPTTQFTQTLFINRFKPVITIKGATQLMKH